MTPTSGKMQERQILETAEFKYLGSTLPTDVGERTEVYRRIQGGWNTYVTGRCLASYVTEESHKG